MNTLFISDLHLDESRPEVTRAFFDFIQKQAVHAQALYILGDFFEAWVGDDYDSELTREILQALKQLTDSGTPTYIMHGNRDFMIGQQFCEKTGCQLLDDPHVLNLYGKRVLLMHGDSLCTDDTQYLAFRAQIRNPVWQNEMMARSVEERMALANQLRAASKDAQSNKAEDITDVTASEVDKVMQEHQVDLLIHGHTHRPAIHQLENGNTRIVLGDWCQNGWCLHYQSDGSYDLKEFPLN